MVVAPVFLLLVARGLEQANFDVDVSAPAEEIHGLILAYGLNIIGAIIILILGW